MLTSCMVILKEYEQTSDIIFVLCHIKHDAIVDILAVKSLTEYSFWMAFWIFIFFYRLIVYIIKLICTFMWNTLTIPCSDCKTAFVSATVRSTFS